MDRVVPISSGSPWHEGELVIQQRAGVADKMAAIGRRNIRDHLIEQHRNFYPRLPFIVAGAVDPAGDAWATILSGRPGFLQSPDPKILRLNVSVSPSDPAAAGLEDGDAIGLLGIELDTRRRNRLNGTIRRYDGAMFDVTVEQSFGNCPQYIRLRDFSFARDPAVPVSETVQTSDRLDAHAAEMIANADTLFIASYVDRESGGRQVDVSHRGGKPGFVQVSDQGALTIPDFAGNLFFNTLGNVLANPKCGIIFVDFETGAMLQLTGHGEVILDAPEIAAFQGAERLLRFTPQRTVFRPGAMPIRWSARPDGASPNALMTGNWAEAAARLRAQELGSAWRAFRVARIADESTVIRSLYLEPTDGAGLIVPQAGQHLPVRVKLPATHETQATIVRTYTLSSAPSDGFYRISVKREGTVSRFLHTLQVGEVIEAQAPTGAFTVDAGATRPAVLLAAGIGVTPILAMLRSIVYEGLRTRRVRTTWVFYVARTKAKRAFATEMAALVSAADGAVHIVRTLTDISGADQSDYDVQGRIGIDLLRATLPFDDYDFYICGPGAFMQDLYDGLRSLSISDARIHAEVFGPAALRRQIDFADRSKVHHEPATSPVLVKFVASDKQGRWEPASGSLLEFAEAAGLNPPYSCRAGWCGSCRTRICAGAVAYAKEPTAEHAENEALICCSVPVCDGAELSLDL